MVTSGGLIARSGVGHDAFDADGTATGHVANVPT
jgi:hypothetical protein